MALHINIIPLLFILTLTQSILNKALLDTSDVIMIVQMTRHGARTPESRVGQHKWIDELGIGELTPVGQRQHFNLGRINKRRYPSLFSKPLQHDEFWIRSTDFNRTIESAFSHMIGLQNHQKQGNLLFTNDHPNLFPPLPQRYLNLLDNEDRFRTPLPLGIKPFPIRTKLRENEDDMFIGGDICPYNKYKVQNMTKEVEQQLDESDNFHNLIAEAKLKYKLDEKQGQDLPPMDRCYQLSDLLFQEAFNNPSPIIPKTDPLYKKLIRCYYLQILLTVGNAKTSKNSSTRVLQNIINEFNRKAEAPSKYPAKFVYYSAHDSTIGAQLGNLGYYDGQIQCLVKAIVNNRQQDNCKKTPPLASNIIWELVRSPDQQFYVRVSYNGKYLDICGGTNKRDSFKCPLKKYISIMEKKYIQANLTSSCELPNKQQQGVEDKDSLSKSWIQQESSEDIKLIIIVIQFGVLIFMTLSLISVTLKYTSLKQRESIANKIQGLEMKIDSVDNVEIPNLNEIDDQLASL